MNNDYNQNNDFNNNYGNGDFNQNQMNGMNGNFDNGYNNGGDFGQDDGYVVYEDDKKEKTKKILIIVLLVLIILIILFLLIKGCQGGGSNSGDININTDVESPIYMGETGKVKIKSNNRSMSYLLEMEDEDIAELEDEEISGSNAKTEIIPKKDGKTTLTITPSNGKKEYDPLQENVVICKTFNEKALVTNKSINIKRGDSMALTFDLGVEGECYSNLTYKPADNSIISVDGNGMITGEKAGSTTLTVSNGSESVKVNVKVTTTGTTTPSVSNSASNSAAAPKATKVTMTSNNKVNKAYAKAGDTVTVTMTFDKKLSQKPVVMINNKAASVGNGDKTFKASVKITNSASDPNGKVDLLIYNYKVGSAYGNQITKASNNVVVDNTKPTCTLGKSGAKLTLTGRDNTGIQGYLIDRVPQSTSGFTSTRTKTATAAGDWYGHVMDKAGNINHCKTSVSSSDLGGASGTNVAVTGLKINASSKSITVGGTTSLTTSIYPSNASETSVSWKTNNTAIATVNSSGVVTGKAAGQAKITATSKSNSSVSDSVVITVTKNDVVVEPEPEQPQPEQPAGDTKGPTCKTKWYKKNNSGTWEGYDTGNWTQYNVRVDVTCTDPSGVSMINIGGAKTYNSTTASRTWTSQNGSISISATDTLGNIGGSGNYGTVGSYGVYIDNDRPTASVIASYDSAGKRTKVTLNCSDTTSGINKDKSYMYHEDAPDKHWGGYFYFENSSTLKVTAICYDKALHNTKKVFTVSKLTSGSKTYK